jgi:hypothetical protein
MNEYVSLPSKRFVELVKKYVNYKNIKQIQGI